MLRLLSVLRWWFCCSLFIVAPIVCGGLCVLFVGGSVFVPCFLIKDFVFAWLCNHLDEEERVGCFTLIVSSMSCDCDSFVTVTLPHGSVGWSAVCDCGIS